jgi:uncharacterized membrane protein YjjB (DUF3815 family)
MTTEYLLLILNDAFWSALAALGFAVLFSVPRRHLPFCALTGALGHALRTTLMQGGMSIELASLLGATVVGLISYLLARRLFAPAPIFAVTGVIPMVPGTFAYRAMIGLVSVAIASDPSQSSEILVEAVTNLVKTGIILGALGFGITAPSLLIDRNRPVV